MAAWFASPADPGLETTIVSDTLETLRLREPGGASPLIPEYELHGELGVGGMGAVFKAHRIADGREVALKIVRPDVRPDRELLSRFRREIRILKALLHPNIVELHDAGDAEGTLWFSMEYVSGGLSLSSLRAGRSKARPFGDLARVVSQVIEGLAHAHSRSVIHRDIKPSNLLIRSDGQASVGKLSDFGLAKSLEKSELNGSFLTSKRRCRCTLPFAAPEQIHSPGNETPATDVFSLAATIYHSLTGKPIRNWGRTRADVIRQAGKEPTVPIGKRDSRVPQSVASLINQSLSLDPLERPPSAIEFRDEWNRVLRELGGEKPRERVSPTDR